MQQPHEMTFAQFAEAAQASGGMNRWPYRGQGKDVQSYNVFLAGPAAEGLPKNLREQEFRDATLEALTENLGLNPKSFQDNVRVAEMVALRHAYMSNCLEQSVGAGLSAEVNAEYFKLTDFVAHPVMQEMINAQLERSTALSPAMAQARQALGKDLTQRAAGGVSKGAIVAQNADFSVQDLGDGYVVAHENKRLTELPVVGEEVVVSYYRGKGHVFSTVDQQISAPFLDPVTGALAVTLESLRGGTTEMLLFSGVASVREFADAHALGDAFVRQALDARDAAAKGPTHGGADAQSASSQPRTAIGEAYKDSATGSVALDYREGSVTYTAVFHSANALAVNAKLFGAQPKHLQQAAVIEDQIPSMDAVQSDFRRVKELYGQEAEVQRPNLAKGRYSGPVIAEGRFYVAQDVGRQAVVVHDKRDLDKLPKLGDKLGVTYRDGRGTVDIRATDKARGRS